MFRRVYFFLENSVADCSKFVIRLRAILKVSGFDKKHGDLGLDKPLEIESSVVLGAQLT
jgi:hypothetical protein